MLHCHPAGNARRSKVSGRPPHRFPQPRADILDISVAADQEQERGSCSDGENKQELRQFATSILLYQTNELRCTHNVSGSRGNLHQRSLDRDKCAHQCGLTLAYDRSIRGRSGRTLTETSGRVPGSFGQ